HLSFQLSFLLQLIGLQNEILKEDERRPFSFLTARSRRRGIDAIKKTVMMSSTNRYDAFDKPLYTFYQIIIPVY
ncbi:MAG: hypothetical protein LBU37_04775, partial [Tannerellaceae bacterium]|nr:hypothetical protein [Tannerellaceae bacterium]